MIAKCTRRAQNNSCAYSHKPGTYPDRIGQAVATSFCSMPYDSNGVAFQRVSIYSSIVEDSHRNANTRLVMGKRATSEVLTEGTPYGENYRSNCRGNITTVEHRIENKPILVDRSTQTVECYVLQESPTI